MERTAHIDTFARDNLPPRGQWPELIFELPGLRYPGRLNCVPELLDREMEGGWGPRVAMRSPDVEITYAELLEQANRVDRVLTGDMGLVPGNCVLLRGANSPWMAASWLAVMKAGGIAVATMPLLRAKELAEIILKAKVTNALCDKRLDAELKAALPACSMLKTVAYWHDDAPDSLDTLASRKPGTFTNADTAAEDIALIAFTSGTTGKPKGTVHFHRDVIAMCDCFPRSCLMPAADDIFCGTPPLAFTFGLGGMLCFPLRYGASTVLVEKHTPQTLLETIQSFKASVCFTTPIMYRGMAAMAGGFDISSLKKCVSAGDAYLMDEQGYFFYQARTDDMIISAGYNIAGPEVEGVLLAHPAVAECGVVGSPDAERGTVVKAFVVLKPGHPRGADLARQLQDYVKNSIAPYKYPRVVEFVDALPRTETGKLQRFKLRQ